MYGFVVVWRGKAEGTKLRHIITLHEEYKPFDFEKWYHSVFYEFEDDMFSYCKTREEVQVLLQSIKESER